MLDETRTLDALETDEAANARDGDATLLDRRVDLTAISWSTLGWLAALLLAVLTRLIERTTWPLTPSEARIASDGLAIVQGGAVSAAGHAQPLATHLVALAFFLFGASDGVARLVPALAGLATVGALRLLRPWLGRAALPAALVVALSPALTLASRRADAGGLLMLGTILLLATLVRYDQRPGMGIAALAGVCAALLPLATPLGWVALAIALLVGHGLSERRMGARDLPLVALGFVATLLVVTTTVFTRPAGLADFLGASLRALWSDHVATLGAGWHFVPLELVADDLFALLLALYAVVRAARGLRLTACGRAGDRALLGWAVAAVVAGALLGGQRGEVYALAALPVALLAGAGLTDLVESAPVWSGAARVRSGLFVLALLLAAAAFASVFGLVAGPVGPDLARWVAQLVVLTVLVLAPLVALALWLARRLDGPALPLAGLAAALLLGALALRTSAMLGATNVERPGELLLAGSTTPDVAIVVDRLTRVSRDLTTFEQDARDPVGGHGLTIAVDRSIAEPFAWYLRDFPNLTVVPAEGPVSGTPQVVISRSDHAATLVPESAGYTSRAYALSVATAPGLERPRWSALLTGAVNPYELRQFLGYLIDRRVSVPPGQPTFELAVRPEIATRLYGGAPPAP